MGFVQRKGRTQGTLFPGTWEELIPDDHVCRSSMNLSIAWTWRVWDLSAPRRPRLGGLVMIRRDLLKLYLGMVTCSRSVPRGDWNRSAAGTLS